MSGKEIVQPIVVLEKRCKACELTKPYDDFSMHHGSKDGRLNVCKVCNRKYQKSHAPERKLNLDPPVEGIKRCQTCHVIKDYSCFQRRSRRKDGYSPMCRDCENSKRQTREYKEARREKYQMRRLEDPQKYYQTFADYRFKTIVGAYDYEIMYENQGGVCAICGCPETSKNQFGVRRLAVDHCHETGEIRGLLCFACNIALGKFNDDPATLSKALEYLLSYGKGKAMMNTGATPLAVQEKRIETNTSPATIETDRAIRLAQAEQRRAMQKALREVTR